VHLVTVMSVLFVVALVIVGGAAVIRVRSSVTAVLPSSAYQSQSGSWWRRTLSTCPWRPSGFHTPALVASQEGNEGGPDDPLDGENRDATMRPARDSECQGRTGSQRRGRTDQPGARYSSITARQHHRIDLVKVEPWVERTGMEDEYELD